MERVSDEKRYHRSGGRTITGNNPNSIGSQTEINITSMKVYNGQKKNLNLKEPLLVVLATG
jgi:hypothetical protein